jgi:leucyl aminopeptidase
MLTASFRANIASNIRKHAHAQVFFIDSSLKFAPLLAATDKANGGQISRALKASSNFTGKAGQNLVISGTTGSASHVVLIGLGAAKDISLLSSEEAGGYAYAATLATPAVSVEFIVETVAGSTLNTAERAARAAYGAKLRSYRFDKYKTKTKPEDKPKLKTIELVVKEETAAKKLFAPLSTLADAIEFTRNIVTEPANIIHPESLAAECKKLSVHGLKVEVLGEKEMQKLGMGSLLGVGQGSVRQSQLVVLQWQGGKKGDKPVALVGKGVTFDTGGISIKPAGGMEEMKFDMAGSATVIGTLYALAARKAKVNAIGVVGLVENMPDGNAQRPGDVVTSMSGQTIEVLNTDAEGRLVLADALWYTQDRFKPQVMIDLATLTGAILVAIGSKRAGLFSNNDKVAESLAKTGEKTGEIMWRLPLAQDYDDTINSDIADMKNISDGREAGSITAAQFLQRFVNDVPWAHLDIAGTAWAKKASAIAPGGATAYGVRLLNDWIATNYEK